jgi:tetratricopeptide (TPR) repeat protein
MESEVMDLQEKATGPKSSNVVMMLGLGLIALIIYVATLSVGVFPGESAWLMAIYTGLEPLEVPMHPLWGAIVKWTGSLSFATLPVRLNFLSALFTSLSVMLVFSLVSSFIRNVIEEEYSQDYAPFVSKVAGFVAAVAFLFSVPVWQAATRLQYQSFDLFLLLATVQMIACYQGKFKTVFLLLFILFAGLGALESVLFIPAMPFLIAFAMYAFRRQNQSLGNIVWVAVGILGVLVAGWYLVASRFFRTADIESLEVASVLQVMVDMARVHVRQLLSGIPRAGWMVLLLTGFVPWLSALMASFRALNNERTMSQYILHVVLSLMVIAGLSNAVLSPWQILKPYGQLPVCEYALLSMTAGYLFAYWYLLLKVQRQKAEKAATVRVKKVGEWMGILIAYPFIVIVVVTSVLNSIECSNPRRGVYADRCAKEILDRLGSRTWFVTDGTLDTHLQIMANQRGQELNLICLQKDMSRYYLKSLWKLVEEKKLFSGADVQQMKSTLELGVLPFIQDWFSIDREIEKKVAVFSIPDFWYTSGLTPIPEYLFFSGCRDISKLDDKNLVSDYMAFWASMAADLEIGKKERNKDSQDPAVLMRKNLRRHMGFVANNLGVLLEERKNEKDAFAVYNYVNKTIDPQNIAALFNRFEMVSRGSAVAVASKGQVEREMREFLGGLKTQYPLWSLSRYYGYVRNPQLFVQQGFHWALSGHTGAALAVAVRGIDLLPSSERNAALGALAAIYAMSDDKQKTATVYQDMIMNDPNDRSAMLGLARLAVQEGAIEKAKSWLEKATKSDEKRGALGVEWAIIHLMNNDLPRARLALQEATDLQPKNLQAWAMLALLQIQQNELDEVERVILPKMEKLAGTIDNYFIQISRAQIAMAKDKQLLASKTKENDRTFRRVAREAFIRASLLRPDIPGVKDMILQLDIEMNDQSAAELHARQVLRTNRKHALANYVMGSLRLQEGEYGEAEDFLRRSVEANPSSAALNDLAEVLRRIKKLADAERFARDAIKKNPDLYVAWETLGAILLEAGKNLDEAESAVNKALSLYKDDPRIKITLARIQHRRGNIEKARETLSQVKAEQSKLADFDLDVMKRLSEDLSKPRQK